MIEDKLLHRWLNDELTDAEKEAFSKREDYTINKNIIDKAKYFKASSFFKVDDFATFKRAYLNRSESKSINWIKPVLKIAAVLIVFFGTYYAFFNSNLVEKQTLVSEKATIKLPDLSKVVLNADSKITYFSDVWDSKRSLTLKGEAYFKVAKGQSFDVITDKGIVTVIGTEFNVKARDNYFEVKCYEGTVRVTSDTITRQLFVGDTYRIINNTFTENKINAVEPQWINNRSSFKAVPLNEVVNELQRQYNVSISFKNTNTTRLFTGGFTHNNLEKALSALTQPMNLTFEISSSNQVLIHGNTD